MLAADFATLDLITVDHVHAALALRAKPRPGGPSRPDPTLEIAHRRDRCLESSAHPMNKTTTLEPPAPTGHATQPSLRFVRRRSGLCTTDGSSSTGERRAHGISSSPGGRTAEVHVEQVAKDRQIASEDVR